MAQKKIIKNANIIDVENYKTIFGNVVIEDEIIKEVIPGNLTTNNISEYEIIDAESKILSPGFIDVHAHADGYYFCGEKELSQGVTTVINGNCGISPKGFNSIKEFYDSQEKNGFNINQTTFTGHSFTLREKAGIVDPYASANQDQINEMKKYAVQGLQEGACGISFGIQYAPGTTTDEFTQIAKIASDHNKIISVHTRLNFPNDWKSLIETLDIAKNTGAEVIVSHLAYMFADGQMDHCLELISDYQAKGYKIHADSGMYTAFSTMAGSTCYDQDQIDANHWDYSQFVAANGKYCGEHLTKEKFEYMRKHEPDSCIICFTGVEEDIFKALSYNNVMVSSDCGKALPGEGHPQDAAVFAKFFRQVVRERKILSIEEAVRRCTYIPSKVMKISDRGIIKAGLKADIVIFDIDMIKERANFPGLGNPDLAPEGINHVFINGHHAIKDGKRQESVNAGRVIKYK